MAVAVHKISGDFYEDSYALIALHSSMEDYAMVYALNLFLKSNFKRSSEDLDISEHVSFPLFEWKDDANDRFWTLITNNSLQEENLVRTDLFKDELSYTTYHLLPEYATVDYLLRIEHDDEDIEENIIKILLAIPKVMTAYRIETNTLKSKNNLIF